MGGPPVRGNIFIFFQFSKAVRTDARDRRPLLTPVNGWDSARPHTALLCEYGLRVPACIWALGRISYYGSYFFSFQKPYGPTRTLDDPY